MAKKAKGYGGFKPPPKSKEPARPRNPGYEQLLCRAIADLVAVQYKFQGESMWRIFQPHCLHYSTADRSQVNVFGWQTSNPNKPQDLAGIRDPEVGKITDLRLTDAKFDFPREFDPGAPTFENGIICCVKRI